MTQEPTQTQTFSRDARACRDSLVWDYRADLTGRFEALSSVCVDVCGYQAAEFLADPGLWERILTAESLALWRNHLVDDGELPSADSAQPPPPLELELTSRGGERRWIEHHCRIQVDDHGRPVARHGINLDITKRKRAELALAQEGRCYQTIYAFNQALIRGRNQDELLTTLCQVVVDKAGLLACVVSRWDHPDMLARAVAWAGLDDDMVARMPLADGGGSDDSPSAPALAWQSGVPEICRACATVPDASRWRLWVREAGAEACCHHPFFRGQPGSSPALGVVSYLLSDASLLDQGLSDLLAQLTTELSVALGYLHQRDAEARMQAALACSEAHLKVLFDVSPVGIALLVDGRIAEVNHQLCELSGYRAEELIGHSTRMLHVSQDAFDDNGRLVYAQLRNSGRAQHYTQLLRKDGEILEVALALSWLDKSDPAQGVIVTALDVTRTLRGQSLLQARLAITEFGPDEDLNNLGIKVSEWARLLTHSTDAMLHLREPASVEIRAYDLSQLWEQAWRHQASLIGDDANRGSFGRCAVVPVSRGSKVFGVLEVRGKAAPYSQVDLSYLEQLASMAAGVIERRRAAEALRTVEERYRVAMQAARDGIWEWNLVTGRIEVNSSYLTMLGYPDQPAWLSFERWQELVHPDDLAQMLSIGDRVRLSDQPFEAEYRLRHQCGDWHWVFARGRLVERDASASPLRVAGIHIDIDERKRAELAARAAQEWLDVALSGGNMGLYEVDLTTGLCRVDHRYLRLLGYQPDEVSVDFATWRDMIHPDDRERILKVVDDMVAGHKDGGEVEYRMRHKSGDWRWILDRSRVYSRDAQGRAVKSGGIHLDITERKASEERLQFAARVFESTSEGILITDLAGRIIDVNRAFVSITGYTADEARGHTPALLRSGRHDAAFYASLWQDLNERGLWQGEIWNRRKNGEVFPQWLTISAVRDQAGVASHYVAVFSDISALRESQDRLDYLAHHDPLTTLPNRLLLMDRLQLAIMRAQREERQIALLFIDLDGFKRVNDTLGHAAGDQLLVTVAERMRLRLRRGDTLGRLGGDEFLLLIEKGVEEGGAVTVAEMMLELLAEPIEINGQEIFVSASIGISQFPEDGKEVDELLSHADLAMYHAKDRGRATYVAYRPDMQDALQMQFNLEQALREAQARGELFLLYQPQLDLISQRLLGVEVLVRWRHSEMGVLLPERFVPLAERRGFMGEIGGWILSQALRQMALWRSAGVDIPSISINCSQAELRCPHLEATLDAVLRETGMSGEVLKFELLGATFLDSDDQLRANIHALRDKGVRFAIDHFGTGSNDLAELAQLRLDALKLHRSLIGAIDTDARVATVCRSISVLGRELGLEVVAEGVERPSQLEVLRASDFRFAQGWLFAKPTDAASLVDWMRQGGCATGS